jgi:CheY-like chemotaxis protein
VVDDTRLPQGSRLAVQNTRSGDRRSQHGEEAIDRARLLFDVILMDLVMPKLDGIEAIKQIVAQQTAAHSCVDQRRHDKVFRPSRGALAIC